MLQRSFQAVEQALLRTRLGQDVVGSGSEQAFLGGPIGDCREKDDGKLKALQRKPALQFEPVDLRHHNVGNDAASLCKSAPFKERATGFKCLHIVSERPKQAGNSLQDARIVVNKCDHVPIIAV